MTRAGWRGHCFSPTAVPTWHNRWQHTNAAHRIRSDPPIARHVFLTFTTACHPTAERERLVIVPVNRLAATRCAKMLTVMLAVMMACSDGGGTTPVNPGGGPPTTTVPVASVVVTPPTASLVVGGVQTLTATARDAAGASLTGRAATWSSSTPAVATVSATGTVSAVAAGTATITATVDGITGSATITVAPLPAAITSVSVVPSAASLGVGQTQALTPGVVQPAGAPTATLTYGTTTPSVATVSSAGVVSAVAPGTTTITVTATATGSATFAAATATATVSITVTASPVASVVVTPATASLVIGGVQVLIATARDAAGASLTGRAVTWSSSTPAVATVSGTGTVSAVAIGTATISATVDGIRGSATITVTASGGGGSGGGGGGGANSVFNLRDSVLVGSQGFFAGAASSNFERIVVTPSVDGSATTRDLLFLDAAGNIEARHNVGATSWAVAMTPDGSRTVAGSHNELLYFFSGTSLVSSGRPATANGEIMGVAISNDGRWVGSGGFRFTLHDWNAPNRVTPVYVDSTTTQLRAIDFSSNGRYVAYGGRFTTSNADPGTTYIAVFDLQTQQRIFRELIPCPGCSNSELRQLAISPDGDRILAGDWGGRLHYYTRDGGTNNWSRATQSVGSRVYWVDMSADGTRAAVGVQESGVRLFALGTTATQLWERSGTDGGQRTVHITPDGRYITASTRGGGGGGGQIVVHDAAGTLVLSRASFAVNTGSGWKARGGAAEAESWFARVSDDGNRALLASFHGVLYFFIRR